MKESLTSHCLKFHPVQKSRRLPLTYLCNDDTTGKASLIQNDTESLVETIPSLIDQVVLESNFLTDLDSI